MTRYGQIVALYDTCEAHKSHGKKSPPDVGDDGKEASGANANQDTKGSSSIPRVEDAKPEVCAAMEANIATKEAFQAAVKDALFQGAHILATELQRPEVSCGLVSSHGTWTWSSCSLALL